MPEQIPNEIKNAAIEAIDDKLEEYSKTEGKTKAGRWGRIGAKILHFLKPFIQVIKFNKK